MSDAVSYRVGEWLPSDQAVLDNWLVEQIERAEAEMRPFHPVIQEFQDFIEGDPESLLVVKTRARLALKDRADDLAQN